MAAKAPHSIEEMRGKPAAQTTPTVLWMNTHEMDMGLASPITGEIFLNEMNTWHSGFLRIRSVPAKLAPSRVRLCCKYFYCFYQRAYLPRLPQVAALVCGYE